MANLRDRLKRINNIKKTEQSLINQENNNEIPELINLGWEPCGYKVYKREVLSKFLIIPDNILPEAITIVIPDLSAGFSGRKLPEINDFLFFDLETTGLSGGAGTVAFLAAFGRITKQACLKEHHAGSSAASAGSFAASAEENSIYSGKDESILVITQYLLLDYPGETDFLSNVLSEIRKDTSVVVSYNGKCFDSQILRTRCLMNRMKPPVYLHADLLHPARRLWKKIIHDCSQISVESHILNIKRIDDIPGSLAPVIWFEFLKTGKTDMLSGICDHNKDDITGLASIFSAMIKIAENPFDTEKYQFDLERLALYWRCYVHDALASQRQENHAVSDEIRKNGISLLRYAAGKNHPRAVYKYAYDLMKNGDYKESYEYVKKGLALYEEGTPNEVSSGSVWHEKLLRRKERLEKKLINR